MVGDQLSDVQAARAAGVGAILIDANGANAALVGSLGCPVVADLPEAVDIICVEDG
jgi:phosphoglycolate phosphatase-like HAD superfamily hydrolase